MPLSHSHAYLSPSVLVKVHVFCFLSSHHCTPPLPFLQVTLHFGHELSRGLGAPDTLEEPILLRKSVEGVVALGARSHEAAERVDLVLAGVAAVLVDFADADLHRCVVLSPDDAVGRAALAGDVAGRVMLVSLLGSVHIDKGQLFPGKNRLWNIPSHGKEVVGCSD